MEKILDSAAVNRSDRSGILTRNALGLYDLEIHDGAGRIVVVERNISYLRAMTVIEENMYQTGRESR